MAWGAAWLYKATGSAMYLGQAQRYLERHYKEDITEQTLYNDRGYYVSSWNNVAWATNVILAGLTDASKYWNMQQPSIENPCTCNIILLVISVVHAIFNKTITFISSH